MQEKPSVIRWPFEARAELYPENASRILTRVREISLHGCYLEFAPLPKGTHVVVKIFAGSDFFEANGSVVFSQPNMGLSLAFRDVKMLRSQLTWYALDIDRALSPNDVL